MHEVCVGTCVQVDGLEADDGGLVVLLVLAVSWQCSISWREQTNMRQQQQQQIINRK